MPREASPAEHALEARHISKYFGDHVALRDISLRVAGGDCVLLYGPNGAGKTTLLRVLASLACPDRGEVLLDGKKVRHDASSKFEIGFVSHASLLYGDLTVRENLRFTAHLFGLRHAEARINEALDLFAMRDRQAQLVRSLSRGLQQRVTLARALLHRPRFLLLDEPFTGLDAASAESLTSRLQHWTDKGIIFSTHSFEQGAAIARRLVVLEGGRLRYDGPFRHAPLAALGIKAVDRGAGQ
jgi:heme exporter protein A